MRRLPFVLSLAVAMLLQMSVWLWGAATPPSFSVVQLPTVPLILGESATATDAQGNLYLGTTAGGGVTPCCGGPEPNLAPVTPGAAQTQPGGGICGISSNGIFTTQTYCSDAYIGKVAPNGMLIYGTYLGGGLNDILGGIAVDPVGNAYVAGTTNGDFPITSVAVWYSISPFTSAGFVAKLNPQGSRFLYATYLPLGGSASAIAADAHGNAYVAGQTALGQAYVAKLSADGSKLLYQTVLSASSYALAIALDAGGNAYVTGQTAASSFPVTPGAFQTTLSSCSGCSGNAFVAKLGPAGNVVAATYYGGTGSERPSAIQVDSAGYVYIAGSTGSLDLPTTPGSYEPVALIPLWSTQPGGFAAKFSPALDKLASGTYVLSEEGVTTMALDGAGGMFLAGTSGAGMPVTATAPQPCLLGNVDVIVAHLDQNGALQDRTYLNDVGASEFERPIGLIPSGSRSVGVVTDAGVMAALQFGDPGAPASTCLSPFVLGAATFFNASADTPWLGPDGNFILGPAVAAGQFFSLSGLGIGPDAGAVFQLAPDGTVPGQLDGVQVFFDELQAPLLYVQAQQINAIAPFELAGRSTTTLKAVYNGATIGSFTASVQGGAPEIFRLQAGLSAQAAAFNQDGTVNGLTNPAAAGTIVTLFGTGLGLTTPPGATGKIFPLEAARSTLNVGVQINGEAAQVYYAGAAPGLLAGVGQINVAIPPDAPSGAVPVQVNITTPNGVQYSNAVSTIIVK